MSKKWNLNLFLKEVREGTVQMWSGKALAFHIVHSVKKSLATEMQTTDQLTTKEILPWDQLADSTN